MLKVYPNPEAANEALAGRIVEVARAAIAARGRFAFVLSGGGTPRGLYSLLAGAPWNQRIDWGRVEFFWSDERCVPPDHPDSNHRMAREALLEPLNIDPARIHRMPAERIDLEVAAAEHERELAQCLGVTSDGLASPFDLVLLGLGADGHTASLFPGTAALHVRDRLVAANEVPQLAARRMTLTYPALNRARIVCFLVEGEQKAEVLASVLEGPHDPVRLPAQDVRPESGHLEWFVDSAAASHLHV